MSHDERTDLRDLMEKAIEAGTRKGLREKAGKWVPYQGPSGGEGWKNTETGDIQYTDDPPGETVDADDLSDEDIANLAEQTDLSEDEVKEQLEEQLGGGDSEAGGSGVDIEDPTDTRANTEALNEEYGDELSGDEVEEVFDSIDEDTPEWVEDGATSGDVAMAIEEEAVDTPNFGADPADFMDDASYGQWRRDGQPEDLEPYMSDAEYESFQDAGGFDTDEGGDGGESGGGGRAPLDEAAAPKDELGDRIGGMSEDEQRQFYEELGEDPDLMMSQGIGDTAFELTEGEGAPSLEEVDEALQAAKDDTDTSDAADDEVVLDGESLDVIGETEEGYEVAYSPADPGGEYDEHLQVVDTSGEANTAVDSARSVEDLAFEPEGDVDLPEDSDIGGSGEDADGGSTADSIADDFDSHDIQFGVKDALGAQTSDDLLGMVNFDEVEGDTQEEQWANAMEQELTEDEIQQVEGELRENEEQQDDTANDGGGSVEVPEEEVEEARTEVEQADEIGDFRGQYRDDAILNAMADTAEGKDAKKQAAIQSLEASPSAPGLGMDFLVDEAERMGVSATRNMNPRDIAEQMVDEAFEQDEQGSAINSYMYDQLDQIAGPLAGEDPSDIIDSESLAEEQHQLTSDKMGVSKAFAEAAESGLKSALEDQ